MKNLNGRVAVVTGAASGIGRALATRCVEEGAKTVLADIDAVQLEAVTQDLRDRGGTVIGVPTDVSIRSEMDQLAAATFDEFGAVHLVCNNAGVGMRGLAWEGTELDWEWVLGVNLWGVIHGMRVFVPLMLEHGDEGHIVNTASIAGLLPGPLSCPYNTSKYAVVGLSESLRIDLETIEARIRVSVLCPGFVQSNIVDAERTRPSRFTSPDKQAASPQSAEVEARIRAGVAAGLAPAEVASLVFAAVREGRFWVLPHPEYTERIGRRVAEVFAAGHLEQPRD